MELIFIARTRDSMMLCASLDKRGGGPYTRQVTEILRGLQNNNQSGHGGPPQKCTIQSDNNMSFHYVIDSGVCFITLTQSKFPKRLVFGFLEDLRDGNNDKLLTAKPFGALAVLFTIFSLFITFQTTTLRFGFDDDSFSLVKSNGEPLQENVVVGGENKWKYTSFSNYNYLPSSKFPILVYFRENQTPIANREEIDIAALQVDNLDGQVHYFPAISNTKQLTDGFNKHGCSHID